MRSRVAVVNQLGIDSAIMEALDLLGSLVDLFENKHVAIKPNETWASPDDLSACTQADSVQAVIRFVKRLNPRKITVSGGSGAGETDQIFEYLGIDKVISEEKVEFFDHNRGPFERIHLKFGPAKEIVVNPYIFSFDTLISLAQHKVHSIADVTLTMKNIAMSLPAADYYGHPRHRYEHADELFFKDIHGFIASMCHRFPVKLGIITGHPAMLEKGPIGGKTFESGIVLASRDFVAVDFIGAHILGKTDVPHIQLAAKYRLGNANVENIDIAGISVEEAKTVFYNRAGK